MTRRPPRFARTDPLFPVPTLVRSGRGVNQSLAHLEIGENLPAVRHEADAYLGDAVAGQAADVAAAETDGALRGRSQPHDRADRGGLAHAVAAHERDHLAGIDGKAHAEQHLAAAVEGVDGVDLDRKSTRLNSSH